MKFSLCVPMYNEAAIIAETAKTLSSYMSEHFSDYEILFSNDGSTDDSAAIVSSLGLPFVRVVGYEKNRGKGAAVREAVLASDGDIVMFTDADLAYGTDVISRVAKVFEENPQVDSVIGSRNLDKDGYADYTLIRTLASKTYIKLLCLVGGLSLSDSQCGCKAFRGEIARRIFSHCEVNGFAFDFEAIMIGTHFGARFFELPVKVINHRESKIRIFPDALKMIKDLRLMKKRVSNLKLDR